MSQLIDISEPRVARAIEQLKAHIRQTFPDVTFFVVEGEDPEGLYLKAILDIDDLDDIYDQEYLDLLYDVQVEQYLPIYVIPLWPIERVAADLAKRSAEAQQAVST